MVYKITLDHEGLYREFKAVAFDTVLDVLDKTYPKMRFLVELIIGAILKTRLYAEYNKSSPSQLKSIFLKNLDEQMTPRYAQIIGLPNGVKLSTWVEPYLKEAFK